MTVTLLNVQTDQLGTVRLVRRLHKLGITILQFQLVSDGWKAAEGEEQLLEEHNQQDHRPCPWKKRLE